MVGDGINDALALTTADVGIAIGAGADIAIDAADAVLMKNTLMDVVRAIKLSKATIRNIHENLFWAFVYNAICIPLAIGLLGVEMKPTYGAAMMALSSFSVCMNALRLNLVKLGGRRSAPPSVLGGHIDDNREEVKEVNVMKKIMHIEGMMCPHCEASVRKALEAIDGVVSATPDHNANTAIVMLSTDVADEVLRAAVEAKDYTVVGIE